MSDSYTITKAQCQEIAGLLLISRGDDIVKLLNSLPLNKDREELIVTHAKLADMELRNDQLEKQFNTQCHITASALDERANMAAKLGANKILMNAAYSAGNRLYHVPLITIQGDNHVEP